MALDYLEIYEYLHSKDGTQRNISFADEQKLKHYIVARDPRALEYSIQIFNIDSMGKMSTNGEMQRYLAATVTITLITRYAITGGMTEDIAFAISDLFLQQLVPNMSYEEIARWHYEMVSTFLTLMPNLPDTTEVTNEHVPVDQFSKLVLQTINYVHRNLHTPLTLKEVAVELFVTPDYLSHKFHSEVGITFSQFVRSQKINLAKLMLNNPDITLADIAHNLAFCSQSYFTKVFREETGMTPNAYLKILKQKK